MKNKGFTKSMYNICYYISVSAHDGQKYGDTDYFLSHITPVLNKVQMLYRNNSEFDLETLECIALLHDVLENSSVTKDYLLEQGVTEDIVEAIVAITKLDSETRHQYLERVKNNKYALNVKIADSLCNLEASIISGEGRRINKYLDNIAYMSLNTTHGT